MRMPLIPNHSHVDTQASPGSAAADFKNAPCGSVLSYVDLSVTMPCILRPPGLTLGLPLAPPPVGQKFYCDTWSFFSTIYFSNFFPPLRAQVRLPLTRKCRDKHYSRQHQHTYFLTALHPARTIA